MDQQLEAFIAGIRPWLLKHAVRICRDRTDAEDLTQEACLRFLKAFPSGGPLPPGNHREAWLITTMGNYFIDLCRKRRVEKQGAMGLALEKMAMAQEPYTKPLYDGVTDEQFTAAVRRLSPPLCATFELHVAGLKYQEIAQAQGIPVGTVGKRLSDARRKLKEMLGSIVDSGGH